MSEIQENGKISTKTRKDVSKIEKSILQSLGVNKTALEFKMKVDVLKIDSPLSIGIDLTKTVEWLFGWFIDSLPGNRYRALLKRAIIKNSEYEFIDRKIKTIFYK